MGGVKLSVFFFFITFHFHDLLGFGLPRILEMGFSETLVRYPALITRIVTFNIY